MFWKKKTPAAAPQPSTPPPLPPKESMRVGKGHPGTFDAPKNPLEESLMAFRERRLEAPRFLEELFNSEVYVLPLHGDIVESPSDSGGFALSKTPTMFCMNYPEYSAIGMFTAPERAKPACELHPEFRFATAVQAGSFLLGLKGDFGIVLNPYWDVNIEWTNDQMRRILGMMRRDYQKRTPKSAHATPGKASDDWVLGALEKGFAIPFTTAADSQSSAKGFQIPSPYWKHR